MRRRGSGAAFSTPQRRLIGWVSYFAIESYGSLMVALFWAFTNASMDPRTAESAYGLIVAFAQLGAIFGLDAGADTDRRF